MSFSNTLHTSLYLSLLLTFFLIGSCVIIMYCCYNLLHKAFSNGDDAYTLKTLDPRYQRTLGQRTGLSFYDTYQLNKFYCADTCDNATPVPYCRNEGYQDPNDCSICKCMDGFSGDTCESLQPSKGGRQLFVWMASLQIHLNSMQSSTRGNQLTDNV